MEIISNKDTAIERYEHFYLSTTTEIRSSLKFIDNLGQRINDARLEDLDTDHEDDTEFTDWSELAAIMPQLNDKFTALTNLNYDWTSSRDKYSGDQILLMKGWIEKHKALLRESEENNEDQMANINPDDLNRLQRFTYNIVQEFKNQRKQLHMILLGTAGTGKSFTVAALSDLHFGTLKRACPTAKAAFLINGKFTIKFNS